MNNIQKNALETFISAKKNQKNNHDLWNEKYPKITSSIEELLKKAGVNLTAKEFIMLVRFANIANRLNSLVSKSDKIVEDMVGNPAMFKLLTACAESKEEENE